MIITNPLILALGGFVKKLRRFRNFNWLDLLMVFIYVILLDFVVIELRKQYSKII